MTTTSLNGSSALDTAPETRHLPPAARPLVAEEHTLAAMLAESGLIYELRDSVQLSERDFYDKKTRAIAEATWRCIDTSVNKTPLQVMKAQVLLQLQQLGTWETVVPAEYLTRLDRMGTQTVVRAAREYAGAVHAAALARRAAHASEEYREDILKNPQLLAEHTNQHTGHLTQLATANGREKDYSIQAIGQDDFYSVPTIYFGIPYPDLMVGGAPIGQMASFQGQQKGGKTRAFIALYLRMWDSGVPTYIATTDGTAAVLKLRIILMRAVSRLLFDCRAKNEEPDPRDLQFDITKLTAKHLTETQRNYLKWARQEVNDRTRLYIQDTTDGIQEYTVFAEFLRRFSRPPYNCRNWAYDHVIDMTNRGSKSYEAFDAAIAGMKALNIAFDMHGTILNQQNTAGNKGQSGDDFGAHGGGIVPARVDCIWRIQQFSSALPPEGGYPEGQEPPKDRIQFSLILNRWGSKGKFTYAQDPASGYLLKPYALPSNMKHRRIELPYIRGGYDPSVGPRYDNSEIS